MKVFVVSETPTTEASVLADLVEWSQDCPAWQRDALRRLCSAPDLDDTDLVELLAICKGIKAGRPLDASHVKATAAGNLAVILRHVRDVKHVNALAEDERLTFARSGLTVVYGDNGSGKSGYARILKHMCRARLGSRNEAILPNIYDLHPGTPTATIDFAVNEQNASSTWVSGNPADPVLSAVSVFDSRTASVHVDVVNDVAYTPFPLRILGQLARSCQKLRGQLDEEIKAIEAQTPQAIRQPPCRADSDVGKLLALVRLGRCTPAEVKELSELSAAETDRLIQLNTDLASDPHKTARQLDALRERLKSNALRAADLAEAVSEEKADALHAAADAYATAREAAAAASAALFADEPLPHIGSDTWRALWEAARRYSEAEAYPGQSFPVAQAPGACVLCQQEIRPEAGVRLSRFETFIKDDSQRRENEARRTYEAAVEAVVSRQISPAKRKEIVRFVADELADDDLAKALRRSIVLNSWRMCQIPRRHGGNGPTYRAVEAAPQDAVAAKLADLSDRAALVRAQADSPERRAMTAERDALAERKWLATVEADAWPKSSAPRALPR